MSAHAFGLRGGGGGGRVQEGGSHPLLLWGASHRKIYNAGAPKAWGGKYERGAHPPLVVGVWEASPRKILKFIMQECRRPEWGESMRGGSPPCCCGGMGGLPQKNFKI